jgi:hypothetical protein
MIKPAVSLVCIAALVSSAKADWSPSGALAAPSARVRRAAAAGVPPEERKLNQVEPVCFEISEGGYAAPVACDEVSCSGPVCDADQGTSFRDGSIDCRKTGAFQLTNPNQAGCLWQYSCCTVIRDDAIP